MAGHNELPPLPLRNIQLARLYTPQFDEPSVTQVGYHPYDPTVKESNLGNRIIKANLGESHFGHPPIPKPIKAEMDAWMGKYPTPELVQNAQEAFRYRWGLTKNSQIFFSDGGSDAVLETLLPKTVEKGIRVLGNSPQFPAFANYAKIWGGEDAYVSVTPESMTLEDGVTQLIEKIESSDEQFLVYVCRPNSPLGDNVSLDRLEELVTTARKKGSLVHIDEAFADVLPMEESAVHLTETHDNVSISGSLSKIAGFSGERIGWLATPPNIAAVYQQRPFATGGGHLVLARYMWNSGLDPFLEEKLPEIEARKRETTDDLRNLGLYPLESHPRTPILALKVPSGLHEVLRSRFKSEVAHFGKVGDDDLIRITILPSRDDNADLAMHINIANKMMQGKIPRNFRER